MACTILDCAQCCTIFSIIGFIFLLTIASLLQTQPLYIKGPSNPSAAADGCYEGALIYLGTFLLSLTYWILDCMRKKAVAVLSGNDSRKKQGNYGAVSLNE